MSELPDFEGLAMFAKVAEERRGGEDHGGLRCHGVSRGHPT